MNTNIKFRYDCVLIAEKICQKQWQAGYGMQQGLGQHVGQVITVRSAEDVIATAEKVRNWCLKEELPLPGTRVSPSRKKARR